MRIETQRLILRPITLEDAEDTYEYAKDPEVGPRAGWEPHKSLEDSRAIMQEVFIGQPGVFGIILPDTLGNSGTYSKSDALSSSNSKGHQGRMIGSVGLLPDPHRQNPGVQMIGYALARDQWGKGYMTEAATAVLAFGFDILGADAISSYTYPQNKASQRVLEKIGMRFETTLHLAERRFDGVVFDNTCYLLTCEEWEAREGD